MTEEGAKKSVRTKNKAVSCDIKSSRYDREATLIKSQQYNC